MTQLDMLEKLPKLKAARGSAEQPALTVRVPSKDTWLEMRAFAGRQGKSLNELFLEGFDRLMHPLEDAQKAELLRRLQKAEAALAEIKKLADKKEWT